MSEIVLTGAAAAALTALAARVGQEVHLSDWQPIVQSRIDAFADEIGRAHV